MGTERDQQQRGTAARQPQHQAQSYHHKLGNFENADDLVPTELQRESEQPHDSGHWRDTAAEVVEDAFSRTFGSV